MTTTWMRMKQNLKQTSRQPLQGMIKTEMVINNGVGGGSPFMSDCGPSLLV